MPNRHTSKEDTMAPRVTKAELPAEPEDPFVAHRGLLSTVAYELLGSAADADDVPAPASSR